MSVDNSRIIDVIGTSKCGERVILTITDHLEWGEQEHLLILQQKLNTYLAFIESGEIFDSYPQACGKSVEIQVITKYQPDEIGLSFFRICADVIQKAGFVFNHEMFHADDPD